MAHKAKEGLRHGWKQGVCDIDRHGKHIPGTWPINHATLTIPMTTTSCNKSNDAHDVAICILVFMRKMENTPKCGVSS